MAKNLTLSIKQQYFDQIKTGEKTHEDREIRPNNVSKYCEVDGEGFVVENEKGEPVTKHYDTITLLTGAYKGIRPKMVVEVKSSHVIILTDEEGNDIVYEHEGDEYIASIIRYELGRILE